MENLQKTLRKFKISQISAIYLGDLNLNDFSFLEKFAEIGTKFFEFFSVKFFL